MQVAQLWRYPVKSLQGERVESVVVTPEGLAGDRRYAIFDLTTGYGLTARREPALLFASATARADGSVEVTLPDGSTALDDDALSVWLGRPVALRGVAEQPDRTYENVVDPERERTSAWEPFTGARGGAFHDSSRTKVSLVSRATMGDWEPRRFRANVVLDGSGEDALVGSSVGLGGAVLDVVKRVDRCVMVTRPQPGGIAKDLDVLRRIHRERDSCLAVGAVVRREGRVSVGDVLDPA